MSRPLSSLLPDHGRLASLTEAYRGAVLQEGYDLVVTSIDGILTVRVALNTAPGFLGRAGA